MKLKDLFPSKEERDRKRLVRLASIPNRSGLSDAELVRKWATKTIAGTKSSVAPINSEASAISGTDRLRAIVDENPNFKFYDERIAMIFMLLKIDARGARDSESIMTYLGFPKDFSYKLIQAFFGQFGNIELNQEEGIRRMLAQKKSYRKSMFLDAMQLPNKATVPMIWEKCDIYFATAARLRQLWRIRDLDIVQQIFASIMEDERDRAGTPGRITKLTFPEMRVIAEKSGLQGPISLRNFVTDELELDKIVAENAERSHTSVSAQPILDLRILQREASPELRAAIERLEQLYAGMRIMGDDDRFLLASRINDTTVARGNMLGMDFYTAAQPNVLALIIAKFSTANNSLLAAKILGIDREFKTKEVYQS